MVLTLKPVTYEPRSDGTVSLAIRLTLNRQVKYWQTGLVLLPKHINPEGSREKTNWIRRSFEAHERANRLIRDRLQRAEEIYELVRPHQHLTAVTLKNLLEKLDSAGQIKPVSPQHPALSWEQVRPHVLADAGESFSDFYQRLIRSKGDTAAGDHQQVVFTQLHTFFGRWAGGSSVLGHITAPILFSELSLERLLEFKIWLATTLKLGPTTLHNKHVRLEEVFIAGHEGG